MQGSVILQSEPACRSSGCSRRTSCSAPLQQRKGNPMVSFRSRPSLIASAAVAVVLAFAAATANARSDTPNVCKLLSANQLATFHVSGPCTQKKTTPLTRQGIHAGTLSWGRWGNVHQSYVIAVLMVINPAYVS